MTKSIFDKKYLTEAQAVAAATKAGLNPNVMSIKIEKGIRWVVIDSQIEAPAIQSARQETEAFIKSLQIAIEASLTDENLDTCMKALNDREPKLEEMIFVAIDEMIGKKREQIEISRMEIEAEEQANRQQIEAVSETKAGKPWIRASSIEKPTKMVWVIADAMVADRVAKGLPAPSRKEVQEECVRQGIASGTARTQYQHWFKTNHEAATAPRATIGADGKIVPATKG